MNMLFRYLLITVYFIITGGCGENTSSLPAVTMGGDDLAGRTVTAGGEMNGGVDSAGMMDTAGETMVNGNTMDAGGMDGEADIAGMMDTAGETIVGGNMLSAGASADAGSSVSVNRCEGQEDGYVIEMGEEGSCLYETECIETGFKQRVDIVCEGNEEVSQTQDVPTSECQRMTAGSVVTLGQYSECVYGTMCSVTGVKTRANIICDGGVAIEVEETTNAMDCERTTDGQVCQEGAVCQGGLCVTACGNGIINPETGEECDDGLNNGSDGCFNCRQVSSEGCGALICNLEGTLQGEAQSGSEFGEHALLLADDGLANDYFGAGLSVDGDYAIIGANEADPRGDGSGAVYLFERQEGRWAEVIKMTPQDGETGDQFGRTVSISGNYAVVGAMNHDHSGYSDSGAAYVYERVNGIWAQVAKLTAPNEFLRSAQRFGESVSIDGQRLIVGAHSDTQVFFASGAAYLFERHNGVWTFTQRIVPSDPSANRLFGHKVAIHDETVVVGTGLDGYAYIFDHTEGDAWIESRRLVSGGTFGTAVAATSDWVAVGDYRNNQVHTYYREAGQWLDGPIVTPPSGGSGQYGYSVNFDQNRLVTSALQAQRFYGQAFIYELNNDQWELSSDVIGDGSFRGFGHLVDLSGDTLMVSEIFNSTAGSNAGGVFVYKPVGPPLCYANQEGCVCIESFDGELCDQQ